jgi:hypothetical protein
MNAKFLLICVIPIGLVFGLVGIVLAQPSGPSADILYVATDGSDNYDCSTIALRCRTVQRAVEVAATGDEIRVASGVYTDEDVINFGYVIALTKTVTLRGGYDGSFSDPPDPTANPTTLDAEQDGHVVSITGDISPTIDGFIITGGDATGRGGIIPGGQDAGGGIYCYQAHPTIVNNVITDNVASSNASVAGGGVYLLFCDRATISGNTIVSNTASTGGTGRGGGLTLDYSEATLSGNVVMSNTASTSGAGIGGGFYLFQSDATVSSNTMMGNVGGPGGSSQGGGLYIQYGIVTLSGNTVQGNVARTPQSGAGGGVSVAFSDALSLDGNRIVDNAADFGSGMCVGQGSTVTLTNNVIAGNQATTGGEGLRVYGDSSHPSAVTLLHNTIADNPGTGGAGLYTWGDSVTLTLTNNIVAGHAVGITNASPGSLTVSADHTLFYGNAVDYGAGVSSMGEVSGDPRFINPVAFNYHIGPTSAALDAGTPIPWLVTDIDGNSRPWPTGGDSDIGADEARLHWVYLPMIRRE